MHKEVLLRDFGFLADLAFIRMLDAATCVIKATFLRVEFCSEDGKVNCCIVMARS